MKEKIIQMKQAGSNKKKRKAVTPVAGDVAKSGVSNKKRKKSKKALK